MKDRLKGNLQTMTLGTAIREYDRPVRNIPKDPAVVALIGALQDKEPICQGLTPLPLLVEITDYH